MAERCSMSAMPVPAHRVTVGGTRLAGGSASCPVCHATVGAREVGGEWLLYVHHRRCPHRTTSPVDESLDGHEVHQCLDCRRLVIPALGQVVDRVPLTNEYVPEEETL